MRMVLRQLSVGLAIGCVYAWLVVPGAATAAVSGPKGQLTASEYQHLQTYLAKTKRAFAGALPNWKAARKACVNLGDSTHLLGSTRAQCLAEMADYQTWLDLHSSKCGGTVLAQLICMNPDFQKLARVVPRLYATDLRLREVGLARGLTGNCLVSLVATKQQLSTERAYVRAAKRTALDVAGLVEVAKTSTPTSAMMTEIANDETALDYARGNWLSAAIAYPLSVCAHG